MASDYEKMGLFEQLKSGLEDSLAHAKGDLTLKTTQLPAPPPEMRAPEVVALRKGFRMSQAVFAAALNVSPRTVQSWEQGEREPGDVALRMLELFKRQPEIIRIIFDSDRRASRAGVARRGAMSRTRVTRNRGTGHTRNVAARRKETDPRRATGKKGDQRPR